jgi:hypothetical protein
MTRLSCHRFRSNEVRLGLSVLAYYLGNLWRRLVLPKRIDNWSLPSLQPRLVKTGDRLIKHARYCCGCWQRVIWHGASLERCCEGSRRHHPQRDR